MPVEVTLTERAGPFVGDRVQELWRRSIVDDPVIFDDVVRVEVPVPVTEDLHWGDRLASTITRAAIDARAGELLMLHACGVAEPESGRVIALVGPSGRGKTTAVSTLGRVWGYVSDETVGVDVQGRVYAHPKPLSVLRGPGAKQLMSADDLGLVEPPDELSLGRVVLLEREPDRAAGVAVEAVPLTEALAVLTPEMSHLRAWASPLSSLAHLLAETGGALRLRYREADELMFVLPGLLSDLLEVPVWSADRASPAEHPTEDSAKVGLVGRARFREAVHDEAGTVLFLDGMSDSRVVLLRGIGPVLWKAASRPRTVDELVEAVVAAHGSPPTDPGDLVRTRVAELVGAGVLVIEPGCRDLG